MAKISWKTKNQIDEEELQEKAFKIREERNRLLQETDYAFFMDYPENNRREALQQYRQSLRDVTLQSNFPEEVVWPEKPE